MKYTSDASSVEAEAVAQNLSQLSCDISQIKIHIEENSEILRTSQQGSCCVRSMIEKYLNMMSNLATTVIELDRKKVLQWVDSQETCMVYQSCKARRHPGTCQWFLKSREYLHWRSIGSLLWVKGEGRSPDNQTILNLFD